MYNDRPLLSLEFSFFPFLYIHKYPLRKNPDLFYLKSRHIFSILFFIGGCILEAFLKFRLLSNQFQDKQRPETFPTFTTILCLIAADMQSFSSCLMLRYMLYFFNSCHIFTCQIELKIFRRKELHIIRCIFLNSPSGFLRFTCR